MTTFYPGGIDTFNNPEDGDPLNAPRHSEQHSTVNDAVVAIETALGPNPKGSADSVAERITALEAAVAGTYGLGLSYTQVGAATTAIGGDPIVLAKPTGVVDGDLLIITAAGHNATINTFPAGFTSRMSYDTDAQEPIYCYTKLASSEPASWSLDTNNASTVISAAMCVALRGPTTFVQQQINDASLTLAQLNGHPNGIAIGVWCSALAAGTWGAPSGMTQHGNYRVAASQPGFMVCSVPTINAFAISSYVADSGGSSSTWYGNLVMIWR